MSDLDDIEILETLQQFDDQWFLCKLGEHSVWIGVTAIAAREAARVYGLDPTRLAKVRMLWNVQTGHIQEHLVVMWDFYDRSFEQMMRDAAGFSGPMIP